MFESRSDEGGVRDPGETRRFYSPVLPLRVDGDSSAVPLCCVLRTTLAFGFGSNTAPFCCVIRTNLAFGFRTIRYAALKGALARTRRFEFPLMDSYVLISQPRTHGIVKPRIHFGGHFVAEAFLATSFRRITESAARGWEHWCVWGHKGAALGRAIQGPGLTHGRRAQPRLQLNWRAQAEQSGGVGLNGLSHR